MSKRFGNDTRKKKEETWHIDTYPGSPDLLEL
jgi:hypothetical protein